MRKIVINSCFGGFGLSDAATKRLAALGLPKAVEGSYLGQMDDDRDNPLLVRVVEELGKEASALYANLEVIEIPDDVSWQIEEYDGYEHIAETHRTWP